MGGRNPYIDEDANVRPVTQKFTITFLPMDVTVEVDPAKIPYGETGLPGSILDIALAHGIDIEHSCGGVCACSTCHCVVRKGLDTLPEATEAEEDMLDNAPGLTPYSRLSCQSVPDGTSDLIVEIPDWNRNAVKEEH